LSVGVLGLVLIAAFLHAVWNSWLKVSGDRLGRTAFMAVALIVAGVFWLGFDGRGADRRGVLFSLVAGALISAYTLLDGLGGRFVASPHIYAAWLLCLTAPPLFAVAGAVHGADAFRMARPHLVRGIFAGILSALAYWIVIWAMSVAPLGLVAAVRETSVVFAALIGGFLMSERIRWLAVLLVFGGVVSVRLA